MNLPEPNVWKGHSYRNVTTCNPTQDLLDDLDLEESDKLVLQDWENKTSAIDHSQKQSNRVFQYGDTQSTLAIFDQTSWNLGRFNTPEFGVWYGALEEKTSEREALHWFYHHEKERITDAKTDIHRDRKMFKAHIHASKTCDLRKLHNTDTTKKLTSEDYTFTQKLGTHAHSSNIDAFLSPSARNPKGTCTPVFNQNVILEDQIIYFLRFTLTKKGELFTTKQGIPQKVLLSGTREIV